MAKRILEFSSVVNKEGKGYVPATPELGITSQGRTFELALENLREAIELFLLAQVAPAKSSTANQN